MEHRRTFRKFNLLSKKLSDLLLIYSIAAVLVGTEISHWDFMKSIVVLELPCTSSDDILEVQKRFNVPLIILYMNRCIS